MLKIFFRKMTEEEESRREVGTISRRNLSAMKCQKEPFFITYSRFSHLYNVYTYINYNNYISMSTNCYNPKRVFSTAR